MRRIIIASLFVGVGVLVARTAGACTRTTPVSPSEMVAGADLIVRATADAYVVAPDGSPRTNGEPVSRIHFAVRETLKGNDSIRSILLPGYLSDRDDFNDHAAPYNFVRSNGRSGSCYANTYRAGADFLLVLKLRDGAYTVNWYALGPVNEQLRGPDDPWLLWMRAQVAREPRREGSVNEPMRRACGCPR